MIKINITEWMPVLRQISKNAGLAILSVYQSDNIELSHKEDNSPLTLADRRSNQIISDGLRALSPDIPIISEEDTIADYSIRKSYEYCWIVDPLDGTKEFVKRNDEFTTNIALAQNGEIILGVVYAPVYNDMYWAAKGTGAFKQHKVEQPQRLQCAPFDLNGGGVKVVCSRSHINVATQEYVATLQDPVLIRKGSSLKMMHIAEGKADLYPRLGPTMEWDTAASQIIIEEAGGSLLKYNKDPMSYNKEDLLNPDFIAHGNMVDS